MEITLKLWASLKTSVILSNVVLSRLEMFIQVLVMRKIATDCKAETMALVECKLFKSKSFFATFMKWAMTCEVRNKRIHVMQLR